jgi:hypothetical protein
MCVCVCVCVCVRVCVFMHAHVCSCVFRLKQAPSLFADMLLHCAAADGPHLESSADAVSSSVPASTLKRLSKNWRESTLSDFLEHRPKLEELVQHRALFQGALSLCCCVWQYLCH